MSTEQGSVSKPPWLPKSGEYYPVLVLHAVFSAPIAFFVVTINDLMPFWITVCVLAVSVGLVVVIQQKCRMVFRLSVAWLGFWIAWEVLTPTLSVPPYLLKYHCRRVMKDLARAIQTYHDQHESFPPAFITDDNGKPIHSWRVLAIPDERYAAAHPKYDFSEPWNGAANQKLNARRPPNELSCPQSRQYVNNRPDYVAVVGPETVWPGTTGSQRDDFRGREASLILVVESTHHDIHWMEPRDIDLEGLLSRMRQSRDREFLIAHSWPVGLFHRCEGFHVCFLDGTVRFLPSDIDVDLFRKLLTNGPPPGAAWETMRPERLDLIRLPLQAIFAVYLTCVWLLLRREQRAWSGVINDDDSWAEPLTRLWSEE